MKLTYTKKPYGRVRYYICGSRLKKRERLCASGSVSADMVEEMVVARVREVTDDLAAGGPAIGPAYLAEVLERIVYDFAANRLLVRLKRPTSHSNPTHGSMQHD